MTAVASFVRRSPGFSPCSVRPSLPSRTPRRTLARTDRLPRAQRDNLNNAGLIQRQVGSRMSNREEGLEQKLRRLLDDLRNFKIANPEAQQQMQNMLERLNMLRDRNLGPAEQGLTRASKSLEQIDEPTPGSAPPPPKDETANPATDQPQGGKDQSPSQRAGKEGKDQSPSQPGGKEEKAQSPSQPASKEGEGKAEQRGHPPASARSGQRHGSPSGSLSLASSRLRPGPSLKPQPQQPGSPQDIARRSLAEAKTNQKAIADELQKMLEGLGEFETYRGVVKDAQTLLKQQEETMKQTAEAATKPDLMGKSAESLSPEQKAELGNLAARQSDLAKGLQNLLERMDDLGKRLDESDPLAASAMREAAGNSRKQGTSAKMGEAAEQLEKNQMGQARAQQDKARQELRELVDAVQNRRERELSRLVKELKKAESEMRDLRKRQAQNLKATRDAKQNPNAQERREPAQEAGQGAGTDPAGVEAAVAAARQVECRSRRSGRLRCLGKMGKAQEELDEDQGDQADKNEEEALADLNDAQDELENDRKEAEERLAMEQLARMGDQLKSLAERQAKMVTETESYENMRRQSNGKLTIAQRTGVRDLGRVQARPQGRDRRADRTARGSTCVLAHAQEGIGEHGESRRAAPGHEDRR